MSYDSNVLSPRTLRDKFNRPLTQTAANNEIDGGLVPLTKYKVAALDLATLINDTAGTASDLLLATYDLGVPTVGVTVQDFLLALGSHATLVTAPVTFTLMAAVRDATLLPLPDKDDLIAATGKNITNVVAAAGDVYDAKGDSAAFYISGNDDYGNAIVLGDALVLDVILQANQAKANQAGTVDAGVQFASFVE